MQSVALVTGASSGIGAAVCRQLRDEGWHVIGFARRSSPDACADIADFSAVSRALDTVPPLRLLVHAAAVTGPLVPLHASDPGAWAQAVEVNLLGTYNVLRAALAGPLAGDHTIAIHLTSGAASNAKPYWSAYNASKAGAEHLVRSAASELDGSSRAVCALDPGTTDTPMQAAIRSSDFPDRERFVRAHEERTSRRPEEVAAAVSELARRDPAALNGRTFRVGSL